MRSHAVRTKQPIWFVSSPKITPRYNLKVVTREFVIKDDYLQFNQHSKQKTSTITKKEQCKSRLKYSHETT